MDRTTFKKKFDFKILTKLFFDAAEERYPSSDKVKQLVGKATYPLGVNPLENLHIEISILNAMREMIKQVAPSLVYRSLQHRDDLYLAIVESSEELEDELEELEEEALEEEEEEE